MSLPHFLIRPRSSLKLAEDSNFCFSKRGGALVARSPRHRALHNFPDFLRGAITPSRLHRAAIAPQRNSILPPSRLKCLARREARSRVARWPHRASIAPPSRHALESFCRQRAATAGRDAWRDDPHRAWHCSHSPGLFQLFQFSPNLFQSSPNLFLTLLTCLIHHKTLH
jgi:hypothetical protein